MPANTAVTDFSPAGTPAEGDVGPTHVSSRYAFVPFALLGIFVLRERITARKTVGLASALAALAVLAGS